MKITGAEFMEWYDNHFPNDHFFDSDDGAIETHGDDDGWLLSADRTYDTDELGYLYPNDPAATTKHLTLDGEIKRWRKSRDFDVLIVEMPKAATARARAIIVDLGGRIR